MMTRIVKLISVIVRVMFPPPEDITPEQAQAWAMAEIRRDDHLW